MLGLLFNREDGADMLLRKSVDFQRTTRRYISEYTNLYNWCLFLESYSLWAEYTDSER
jgi:hypothetical protein